MFGRRFPLLAVVVGLAALALYVATLAPGLVAIEDTPKFQFIGRILGTAHPPGYPFYVMTSHLFGLLPIGNLAWRINLLSAVYAALTVVLLQLAAMELGAAPVVAAVAGLGLATGSGLWLAATIAEVYSLHGLLLAAMTVALLRWRRTGRPASFFAAIACFSIGLGHHTSIVMVGPAVALFAIVLAPRFALHPKTIAAILGCFALGFAQYLFVLVRTRQGAWGEAPASTLPELWDVIRGARWAGYVAPISFATLAERGPAVVGRLVHEVSLPASVLALAGLVTLARRDRPSLILLLGSTAGVVLFSTFFSGQTDGFLQPAFVFLWLLAAVGLESVLQLVRARGRYVEPSVALLLAGLVVWQASGNLEARDLSHRRFEMRYFDALAAQLPPHSGLMAEDFLVDRMVLYERFSQPTFADRNLVAQVEAVPERVREFMGRGYGLFAFGKSAGNLRREGLAFDYAMWPMEYGPIRQFLGDQPRGTTVAMAIPAMRLGEASQHDAAPFDLLGGTVPGPSFSNVVLIGVTGGAGPLTSSTPQQEVATVFVGRGQTVGRSTTTSPADITAFAVFDRASIRIGGREIIGSREPVLAVWSPSGELVAAVALNSAGRMPMPASPLSVHRLRGVREWTPLGAVPSDISPDAAGGHLMVRQRSAGAPVLIYAGRSARGLAPKLIDVPASFGALRVTAFEGNSADLRASLLRDNWPESPGLQSAAYVDRVELPPSVGTFHLSLGGLPDVTLARGTGGDDPPSVFGFDLIGQLERMDEVTERLHVARDHHQAFLAGGWSPVGADETGGFVLTLAPEAELLLPCTRGNCATVDLQLWTDGDGDAVSVSVNGTALPGRPLRRGWNRYRWAVPPQALHEGMNAFVLQPARQVRLADVLVSSAR